MSLPFDRTIFAVKKKKNYTNDISGKANPVPRALRLFGQRVGAGRDSGEFEKN